MLNTSIIFWSKTSKYTFQSDNFLKTENKTDLLFVQRKSKSLIRYLIQRTLGRPFPNSIQPYMKLKFSSEERNHVKYTFLLVRPNLKYLN